MDPRDFLTLAKTLLERQTPTPADCRTAISRSYYAALLVAKSLVEEIGIPLNKVRDSHSQVVDVLAGSDDRVLKGACDRLSGRKAVRVNADYNLQDFQVETVEKAGMEVCLAQGIIDDFDKFRRDERRWKLGSQKMTANAHAIGIRLVVKPPN
jgi:hypothetical protein